MAEVWERSFKVTGWKATAIWWVLLSAWFVPWFCGVVWIVTEVLG